MAGAVPVLALVLLPPAARVYYGSSGGTACTRCHEIEPDYNMWHTSSHRGVQCGECHESSSLNNLRRVYSHMRGDVPEQVHLRNSDIPAMMERCRSCHRQEFADWQAGPHSSTYARIFLDEKHNAKFPPMDDCLRCHGMHFEGGVREVANRPDLHQRPAMPCLACHQVHRPGSPLQRKQPPEINRPSLAFYDRRSQAHVAVTNLPLPEMKDGERMVNMSPDPRQALCYQCHAPRAGAQAVSGDDRTAIGVHEGISCLACHQKHGQQARASCATCHPRLSNCGLDVEKMDTTFSNKESRHNIHRVKCQDCHPKGVPKKRQ
jgi:hypothetical protein